MKKFLILIFICTPYIHSQDKPECGKKIDITRQHSCLGDYDQYSYDGRIYNLTNFQDREDLEKIMKCSNNAEVLRLVENGSCWYIDAEGCSYPIAILFWTGVILAGKDHWKSAKICWGISGGLFSFYIISALLSDYYYKRAIKQYNESIPDTGILENPVTGIIEDRDTPINEYGIAFTCSF